VAAVSLCELAGGGAGGGRQWSAWAEDRRGPVPALVAGEWDVVRERAGKPLRLLAEGDDWRMCEDLAQSDNVAEVIRSVGPALVITPLLDGPQLASRWAARYASVFADDPGSAVLTLTSFGLAQRCRPLAG
jgi:hypothetical protein